MTDHQQPLVSITSTDNAQGNTSLSFTFNSDADAKDEIKRTPLSAENMTDLVKLIRHTEQAAQGSMVEEVDLNECDLTDQGAFQGLLELVTTPSTMGSSRRLILSGAKFSGKSDFSVLLSTLGSAKNSSVRDVNLSNYLCSDYVSSDGSFRRLLEGNTCLESLNLSGHSLSLEVVADLTQGLRRNSTLQDLEMHNCFLDEAAADLILKSALEQDSLRVLDLSANNHFSPIFLNNSVASYMRRTKSLQSFTLDHSGSMFAVANPSELQEFLDALRMNKTLDTLSIRYCRLKQDMGEAILSTLAVNDTLKTLNIEFTGFGLRDRGNEILIKLLPKFKALETLKMHAIFSTPLAQPLLSAMRQNSTLQSFHPRISPGASKSSTQNPNQQVQSILRRNKCLQQSQQLLKPSAFERKVGICPAMLPSALAKLSAGKDGSGSAASFQLLEHWIGFFPAN
mmetsp:Transcript_9328/g.20156  ORF Transcript_9328/g.20156 Transcript_9328/m.20156 type:complete len:453 (-) Transcript_9328:79-1437(-)